MEKSSCASPNYKNIQYPHGIHREASVCLSVCIQTIYLGGNVIWENHRCLSAGVGHCTGHTWGYCVYVCNKWFHHSAAIGHHCDLYQSAISVLYTTLPINYSSIHVLSFPSLWRVISHCPIEGDVPLHFALAASLVVFPWINNILHLYFNSFKSSFIVLLINVFEQLGDQMKLCW